MFINFIFQSFNNIFKNITLLIFSAAIFFLLAPGKVIISGIFLFLYLLIKTFDAKFLTNSLKIKLIFFIITSISFFFFLNTNITLFKYYLYSAFLIFSFISILYTKKKLNILIVFFLPFLLHILYGAYQQILFIISDIDLSFYYKIITSKQSISIGVKNYSTIIVLSLIFLFFNLSGNNIYKLFFIIFLFFLCLTENRVALLQFFIISIFYLNYKKKFDLSLSFRNPFFIILIILLFGFYVFYPRLSLFYNSFIEALSFYKTYAWMNPEIFYSEICYNHQYGCHIDFSVYTRLSLIFFGFKTFLHNPFGVGLPENNLYLLDYIVQLQEKDFILGYGPQDFHSDFLNLLTIYGVSFLFLFLAILFIFFIKIYKVRSNPKKFYSFLSFLFMFLIKFFFDSFGGLQLCLFFILIFLYFWHNTQLKE